MVFPPERLSDIMVTENSKIPEERRCSNVVIDPTQKNEALPPLSLSPPRHPPGTPRDPPGTPPGPPGTPPGPPPGGGPLDHFLTL